MIFLKFSDWLEWLLSVIANAYEWLRNTELLSVPLLYILIGIIVMGVVIRAIIYRA